MSQHLCRRCGCRDENGRQYGKNCPTLKSDLKHGTWAFAELTGAGRGAVKVRRGLATLRMIFSAAVRDEIIPRKPGTDGGHGPRHSAASLMLAGGADISTVSKLLGHSSIAITADVYAHLIASVGQRAVEGAAALIPRKVALTVHTQPGVLADARLESRRARCPSQGQTLVGLAGFAPVDACS